MIGKLTSKNRPRTGWLDRVICRNLLSCRFLSHLNESIASQVQFPNYDAAFKEARHGNLAGIIYFSSNFTKALEDISINGKDANNGSFDMKDVEVYLDKSDQQITFFLERKLRETFMQFAQQLMEDCGFPRQLGNIPVAFETPIYGSFDEEFTNFVAPGVVMT